MKLLEEGNWKIPWSMEVICIEKGCGAKVLIEEKDVKPVDYDDAYRYYAVCMVCERNIYISEKDVPQRMKNVLDKKRKYRDRDSDWR